MAEGKVVAEGAADSVMSNPAVIDAYLGAHHDTDLGDDELLEEENVKRLEAEVAQEEAEREEEKA
jgi:branched-chain amino acid transport system ATP-binding protein